jgi:hypothetical protein
VLEVAKDEDRSLRVIANGQEVPPGQRVELRNGMVVSFFNKTYPEGKDNQARFAEKGQYTTPHVVAETPTFTVAMDLLPTFSQRIDVAFGLKEGIKQLNGTMAGILGRTVRIERGPSMEAAYPDTTFVIDEHTDEKLRYSQTLEDELEAMFRVDNVSAFNFPTNRFSPGGNDGQLMRAAFKLATEDFSSRSRKLIERAARIETRVWKA